MSDKWKKANDYKDIIYEKIEDPAGRMDGIAKITINRPEVRNAFRIENIFSMTDIIHSLFYNGRFNPSGLF